MPAVLVVRGALGGGGRRPPAVPHLDPQTAHAAARAAHLGAVHLRTRRLHGLGGRRGDGQHALAAVGLGLGLVLGGEAERGERRRQQRVDHPAVAVGRRVEAVRPEQQRGGGLELGPEDRGQRDGPTALLDDRDRLGGGEAVRPGATDLLERGRDRLDRPEVGTGPDDDLDAGVPQPSDRLREVPHRLRRQHAVGHVVGADQDDGDVGLGRHGAVDLADQVRGACAHHGVRPQVHAAVGALREAAGQEGAGRLGDALDAVPGRAGVTQQRDLDRRAGTAAAVPAGRVGRRARRLADGAAGQLGLRAEQAVEPGPEHGQATAAVRRRRRQLPSRSRCPHAARLRTANSGRAALSP